MHACTNVYISLRPDPPSFEVVDKFFAGYGEQPNQGEGGHEKIRVESHGFPKCPPAILPPRGFPLN